MIVRSVKIWEDASGHFSAAVVLRPSALELSARDRDTRDRMVMLVRPPGTTWRSSVTGRSLELMEHGTMIQAALEALPMEPTPELALEDLPRAIVTTKLARAKASARAFTLVAALGTAIAYALIR